MDPLNNNNNNNIESESPLSATMKTSQNISTTSAHPLEDIPLNGQQNISEMQQQRERENMQMKKNWVKFDDDVNETSSSTSDNNTQNSHDQADSTMRARAATTFNKLSTSPTALLPPPPQTSHVTSRSRSPVEREKSPSPSQLQREPVEISPLSEIPTPTPAQRSIVSSNAGNNNTAAGADLAPAVLTTESTHVNLNASGRAQQPQHQLNQNHPSAVQKTTNTRAAPLGGSGNQQQHLHHQRPLQAHHTQLPATQHHSNNSNNGTTIATATNNAMHHKSHHQQHHPHSQQHQQIQQQQHSVATVTASPVEASTSMAPMMMAAAPPALRTIELSTGRIREGFANGDVIVTLLPANTKWPWITPAIFRPELVPEELMAQGLTLTVEDYVQAMETLVNDYRFTLYNICYKRILVCWILLAFVVLLALLFSGLQGVALFSLGVGWLFMNASAIFICMWVKLRLSRGLEKCLARVNRQLIRHKILLILDDRGRISCHKVNLCFLYFDSTQCVQFLNEFLENTERNGGEEIKAGWESKLDIDLNDIVIQGSTPVRLSRKQAVAQELYLSYVQRWGKDFLRRRLDWTVQEAGVHEMPRHIQSSVCPCQYEEEILRNKIKLHLRRKRCLGIDCMGCWL